MPRLLRPAIPLEVKCRVILRQLGEMFPDDVIRANRFVPRESIHRRSLRKLLDLKLQVLAALMNCAVDEFRLDHDPALGARRKVFRKKVHVGYEPAANDPDHLLYRPHGPQFEASHLIKTNVRGEHGQHPDRVLIKKNRRLERGPKPKRKAPIRSRGFTSESDVKTRWPKRKFERRSQ